MRGCPLLSVVMCIGVLSADMPAAAQDRSRAATDKAELIRTVLRDLRSPGLMDFVTEDGTDLYRPREWVEWCEQFGADFHEQRGIEHVEPAAQSERYDDPVFRPWQERCPLLAFNARAVSWWLRELPPGPRGDWLRGLPPHMPDGSEIIDYQYATRDFQLFEGDFDNDDYDEGGKEVIFFADAYYSYWDLIARDERLLLAPPPFDRNWNDVVPTAAVPADLFVDISADYRFLDLDRCLSRRAAEVWSPYYTRLDRGTRFHSGLIKYRGQYYFFELETGEKAIAGSYNLELTVIKPQREAMRHEPVDVDGPPYCRFTAN